MIDMVLNRNSMTYSDNQKTVEYEDAILSNLSIKVVFLFQSFLVIIVLHEKCDCFNNY